MHDDNVIPMPEPKSRRNVVRREPATVTDITRRRRLAMLRELKRPESSPRSQPRRQVAE
jgi:hypothetical protein